LTGKGKPGTALMLHDDGDGVDRPRCAQTPAAQMLASWNDRHRNGRAKSVENQMRHFRSLAHSVAHSLATLDGLQVIFENKK
jgi:hypothetical protein